MKQIPQIVKDAAKDLIKAYGGKIDFLGKYEGADAYMFHFPNDSCTGFPFVYIHKDGKVTEITGFEAERSGLNSGSAIYWLCDLEQVTVILSFSFLIHNVGHI